MNARGRPVRGLRRLALKLLLSFVALTGWALMPLGVAGHRMKLWAEARMQEIGE